MHLTADSRTPCGSVSIVATGSASVGMRTETTVIIHGPCGPLICLRIITGRVRYDENRALEVCLLHSGSSDIGRLCLACTFKFAGTQRCIPDLPEGTYYAVKRVRLWRLYPGFSETHTWGARSSASLSRHRADPFVC